MLNVILLNVNEPCLMNVVLLNVNSDECRSTKLSSLSVRFLLVIHILISFLTFYAFSVFEQPTLKTII
jgi:hypothetical protein